ncbi:unnamed protein product, partial [Mesorhabditis spiculigera]
MRGACKQRQILTTPHNQLHNGVESRFLGSGQLPSINVKISKRKCPLETGAKGDPVTGWHPAEIKSFLQKVTICEKRLTCNYLQPKKLGHFTLIGVNGQKCARKAPPHNFHHPAARAVFIRRSRELLWPTARRIGNMRPPSDTRQNTSPQCREKCREC